MSSLIVPERESLADFSEWRIDNQTLYNSVAYSPDGKFIASGSSDGMIRVWDTQTGRILKNLQSNSDHISSVVYSPDGKWITSSSFDNTVQIWSAETGQNKATLQNDVGMLWSVTYSPDGKLLASGSNDKVLLWDQRFRVTQLPAPTNRLQGRKN